MPHHWACMKDQLITESGLNIINIIRKNTCVCEFLFYDIKNYLDK